MKLRNRIRQKVSINSINEMVIDGNRRELKNIVVDILKTVTGVRLYGYRMMPVNLEEDFKMTNIDYMHKTKNKDDIYIDMSDDVISCMECYFVLSEDKISKHTVGYGKANTRREITTLPKLDWFDERLRAEILTYPLDIVSPNKDVDTSLQSLLIRVNLYIPRLVNNVIKLNGNHYFNKFHIQNNISLTKEGKLKYQHPSYVSYMYFDDSKNSKKTIFVTSAFGKIYNSLLFLEKDDSLTEAQIENILSPIDDDNEEVKDYYRAIIKNTIEDLQFLDREDPDVENIRDTISGRDVRDAMYSYIIAQTSDGKNEETISLHTSLRSKLRNEIKKGLKIAGRRAKKQNLEDYRSKVNVDPRTVCTIIKNNNQYSITKSANEVDIYNFFGYVSNIEDSEELERDRTFTIAQLGIIDPIGTSTSENVGLAGGLAFSIPDIHLSHKEE
jgi:hypothetical protein